MKLGAVLQQTDERGHEDLPLLGVSVATGVRARSSDDGRVAASLDLSGYKRVLAGQIIMNALGKPHGSIGRSETEGITSPAYWVLNTSAGLDSRFAHHLLRSQWAVHRYWGLGKNLPPNQFDLPWETFKNIEIYLPGLEEQRRIADFLDDRVVRIDQIIAARARQLGASKHAHTAELQQMQDEWTRDYGEVKLSHVLVAMEQGWSPQAEGMPAEDHEWGVVRAGCVNGGAFREADNKRLPDDLDPQTRYEIRPGDLLMSRASGSLDLIGSVAVVSQEVRPRLLLCDKVYRLKPSRSWEARFIAPMLRTHRSREAIRLGVSGAEGMANNLPSGVIMELKIPRAPMAVQLPLAVEAEHSGEAARSFELLVTRSMDRLAEYKQSLITVAVTGELDVTTASTRVPGE